MEEIGVMIPYLKAFFGWHILGLCILLVVSGVVRKVIKT